MSPKRRRWVVEGFKARRARRQARLRAGLISEYCATIARRLHAGETLLQALTAGYEHGFEREVEDGPTAETLASPLAEPIRRLRDEHNRGATLARAVQRWAERDDTEQTALLSTAVSLATQQVGADPALFDHVVRTLSSREELISEAHVQVAQARASIWVVAALPWAIAAVLVVEGGAAARVLVGTTLGRFCLGLAVLMELAGIGWMRWLIERSVPWPAR